MINSSTEPQNPHAPVTRRRALSRMTLGLFLVLVSLLLSVLPSSAARLGSTPFQAASHSVLRGLQVPNTAQHLHHRSELLTSSQASCQPDPVHWVFPWGVLRDGNSITKIGGIDGEWDAGASGQIYYEGDLYVDVLAEATNTSRAFGLSSKDTNGQLDTINYALALQKDGTLAIYELGSYQGNFGPYNVGDRPRVAVEEGVVNYYRDDTLLFRSKQVPTYPLSVDSSINTMGGRIVDADVCGTPPSPPSPVPTESATATNTAAPVATASATATASPTQSATPAPPSCNGEAIALVGDDGASEGLPLSYLSGSAEQAALWLVSFPVSTAAHLDRISVTWPSPQQARGVLAGRSVRILAYYDPQSRGTPVGATPLYDELLPLTIADGVTFQDFYVDIDISGAGDVYIGFEDAWAEGGYSPAMYPALLDRTASRHRSWVIGNGTLLPDRNDLGANRDVIPLDSADPGNWMIRGSGTFCESGTPQPTQTRPPAPTPLPGCELHLSDVSSVDWFFPYVRDLYCRGVVSGYQDGTFKPYNGTTRGQLAKMVVRAFNLPSHTENGPHFTDVPTDNTFYDYIETVRFYGVAGGYSDGTFRPNGAVTRGQLAKMVTLAARQANPLGWPLHHPLTGRFTDVPYGSTFYPYVETAAAHSVLGGYTCGTEGEPCPGSYFRPQVGATRAQISKIVDLAITQP